MSANVVFYRGPSLLTGDPILAVAVGLNRSRIPNVKTGHVVQAYILRSDMDPIRAVKSGGDAAICGSCKLRGDGHGNQRACYVTYFRNPFNIYRALPRAIDERPERLAARVAGKHLRLGAYGDPVAVPMAVWLAVIRDVSGFTGYTHRWREASAQPYRAFLMASVDSVDEQREASALGWRTFRVRPHGTELLEDEVICPASAEANHASTCQQCGLCRGLARSAKSVAIFPHGSGQKWIPVALYRNAAAAASSGARL